MNNKANQLTNDQASDIIIAESFGREAFNTESAKAPFQCKQLAPMLRKHNGPIGTGIIDLLCKAWAKGQEQEVKADEKETEKVEKEAKKEAKKNK